MKPTTHTNGKLIIARHQESEWNKLGLWTGSRDRHLTAKGFKESEKLGLLIKDIRIDKAFASMQVRSIETLSCILNVLKRYEVPLEYREALNERDYGEYTGKNKWDVEKLIGEEEWNDVRRDWDYPVPDGETLRLVYDRVLPFFITRVMPCIERDENVLIVGHGNSLRALLKYIEKISDEDIKSVEMPFGTIIIYDLDDKGHVLKKEVRQIETSVNA